MHRRRLLIIGLDGATWDILNPLIEEGYLPHLKNLKERGSSGILRSNFPPITGSAWMSIATGKNPGETGIFDFLVLEDKKKWKLRPITSWDYKRNGAIWDFLSNKGRKVGIVNYPMLYPPYEVNGVMISGLGASENGDIFYPKELKNKIREVIGRHRIYVPFRRIKYNNPKVFVKDITNLIEYNYKLADYLIDETYDFFIFVISASDFLLHYGWKWWRGKSSRYCSVFKYIWKRIDRLIGLMIEKWGNGNVMIISDHGMGELKEIFLINEWLEREGYLVKKFSYNKFGSFLSRRGVKLRLKFLFDVLVKVMPESVEYLLYNLFKRHRNRYGVVEDIDLRLSKAFALEHCGVGNIYINPDVETMYEEVKSSIINKLKNFCRSANKKLQLFTKETLYRGKFLDRLPDILFMIDDNMTEVVPFFSRGPIFRKPIARNKTGSHRMEGVIIIKDLPAKDNSSINFNLFSLTDIFRIICVLLDESPLSKNDKVTTEVDEECLGNLTSNMDEEKIVDNNHCIEKRLRELGYL